MANDRYLDEFPDASDSGAASDDRPLDRDKASRGDEEGGEERQSRLLAVWEGITQAGLGETVFRLGTHLLSISLVLLVVWVMRAFYLKAQQEPTVDSSQPAALAASLPTPTPTEAPPKLPEFSTGPSYDQGIPRLATLYTVIPTRPRTEVITYTVQDGDTLFGIAEKFNLMPETLLWGNTYILGDNPHLLRPGMELNILPANGTYHRWSTGEGLNGVANGYGVKAEDIINWPGNNLDPDNLGDWSNPNIEAGTMLFVPGGQRAFVTWSAPRINRNNPGVAKILGPGWCGTVVDGAVGTGSFIYPTNHHYLSGFDYSPSTNHYGIDLDGDLGDPIYASDNGVIVYAGWNNWGYGYVVVIDHAFGWQTLYAHLSYIGVGCGQSVYQGSVIGSMGSTGNSSGPHLHFEMLHETYGKVNPWDFLPPP
jgi:murein DD-endopeptidase MepM/ murein hydrolase activator NlpD